MKNRCRRALEMGFGLNRTEQVMSSVSTAETKPEKSAFTGSKDFFVMEIRGRLILCVSSHIFPAFFFCLRGQSRHIATPRTKLAVPPYLHLVTYSHSRVWVFRDSTRRKRRYVSHIRRNLKISTSKQNSLCMRNPILFQPANFQ